MALTCEEAPYSASAAERTSPMICEILTDMFCIAASSWPVSSFVAAWILTVRSPSARWLAAPTASLSGFVMLRVTQKAAKAAKPMASTASTIIRRLASR